MLLPRPKCTYARCAVARTHESVKQQALKDGRERRPLRVDLWAPRPYRAAMAEETVASGTVPVSLTPGAVEAAKRVRASEGLSAEHGLRVSVVGGGCSGFSYQLSFDRQRQEGDLEAQVDGLPVWVDPTSAQYLEGTQIDFVSSLNGGGFKFSNPKATQTCGCGSSFSA